MTIQQQPPRKRTRTSPNQLAVLERTFTSYPSPSGRLREQLSKQLGMTERSIQIWFQNRRAKEKNLARRTSIAQTRILRMQQWAASAATTACQMQDTYDAPIYYYYYYYYYNQQQQQPSSKFPPAPPPPPPPPPPASMVRAQSADYNRSPTHQVQPTSRSRGATMPPLSNMGWSDFSTLLVQHQFSADILEIGTWKRMVMLPNDIHCFCDLVERQLTWVIQDGPLSFKMIFALDSVQTIQLQQLSEDRMEIKLTLQAPEGIAFYMNGANGWTQCRDFSQDKQATLVPVHRLEGPAVVLWTEWQGFLQTLPEDDPLHSKIFL
ncbi:homeobox-domain-containing protein [Lichtheimia hyalospora FSU 10163]|nr:homeobox-domain-containing protein [Lichtheimia hyalospora FSU 10163]